MRLEPKNGSSDHCANQSLEPACPSRSAVAACRSRVADSAIRDHFRERCKPRAELPRPSFREREIEQPHVGIGGTFHDYSTRISIPLTEFSDLLGDSPGNG